VLYLKAMLENPTAMNTRLAEVALEIWSNRQVMERQLLLPKT
jgi:hypothetical protein